MGMIMPWLLMVAFGGSNTMVTVERFETEALCNSAASAVVEFYSQTNFVGYKPEAWKCENISSN
jgi:hypothetical protein